MHGLLMIEIRLFMMWKTQSLYSCYRNANGISQTFISYSNPSRLSNEMIESYEIVQDVSEDQKLIKIGGMAGLHTEIRLLNYIYAHNRMPSGNFIIHLFSARTVCGTCKNSIDQVRTFWAPKNIGIKYYSLRSEKSIIWTASMMTKNVALLIL